MSKINSEATKLIDQYIAEKNGFAKELCMEIRELIHHVEPDVTEDWKWRTPVFDFNGLVCGIAAFKHHVSLHFFNGAHIGDPHGLFGEDCDAQHSRSMKFKSLESLNKKQVAPYLRAAFDLQELGFKPEKKQKEINIPPELKKALATNKLAKSHFDKMAYTYQKEYAEHIATAKREATKLRRLEKVIANLEKNIKMHEQYK